jgi:hypothetical protein
VPKITFDTVAKIGLELPGVELATSYGVPALKAGGRLMATMATNKSAEPNSLCVCMDVADRDELLAADPGTYYLTPHYVDYPCIVIRLARLHDDALRDLLGISYRFCLARAKRKRTARPQPARPRRARK